MPTGDRPPTPSDVCRIAVNGTYGGRPFTNVYHVQTDEDLVTSGQVSDMLDAFSAALVSAQYLSHLSNAVHVTQFQGVSQLDADNAVEATKAVSHTGSISGAAATANVAAVISWLSSAYWRGGKPRTYLPGVPEADIDNVYSIDDTWKAALASDYADVLTNVNGITTARVDQTKLGFVSYATGGEWRSPPLFFAFSGNTVHDRIASQRRRLGPWLP